MTEREAREATRQFAKRNKRAWKRLNKRLDDLEALMKRVEQAISRLPERGQQA